VLDLMLPGIDTLEVCRRLRDVVPIPVAMLTAMGDEENPAAGRELGADDYVGKPFSPRELALRVGAVLRRTSAPLTRAEGPLQRPAADRRIGGQPDAPPGAIPRLRLLSDPDQ